MDGAARQRRSGRTGGAGADLPGVDGARAGGAPGHGAPLGGRLLRGERADDEACADVEREGLASPDLLAWLDEGAKDLLSTLAFAPADLDVWFFLKDSPGPRQGWARRQCHETTIHAVDAMAAARGSVPPAAETWIHAELAADGVDELLMGFVPRRRTGLELPEPRTVVVRTTDTRQAWTLRVGEAGPRPASGEPARGRDRRRGAPGHRGPGLPRALEPRRRGRPAPTRSCSSGGVRTCRCSGVASAPRRGQLDGHEPPDRPLRGDSRPAARRDVRRGGHGSTRYPWRIGPSHAASSSWLASTIAGIRTT